MNIYQMYEYNNHRLGFFIVRNSWEFTFAQVVKIEGVEDGKPINGEPPYYGNPKVTGRFYQGTKVSDALDQNFKNEDIISCPGTYGYSFLGTTPENWKYIEITNEKLEKYLKNMGSDLSEFLND